MAASTTSFPAAVANTGAQAGVYKRRHIDPKSGRALEILGHAIEYLADEYAHEGFLSTDRSGRLEAIQLLMKVNRGIYFDCPEIPRFRQRFFSWLRGRAR